jgi:hypothetical protein
MQLLTGNSLAHAIAAWIVIAGMLVGVLRGVVSLLEAVLKLHSSWMSRSR